MRTEYVRQECSLVTAHAQAQREVSHTGRKYYTAWKLCALADVVADGTVDKDAGARVDTLATLFFRCP